jgi:glyoxylase-like metal-dependent hydrolase (beta-lactamase superfamily II)
MAARKDPARRQRVACLGLIDDASGQRFLIDATPDLASQLDSLNEGRALRHPKRPVDGILLTHAHIGHYTGLMYLGREALGADHVPVFSTPRMAAFPHPLVGETMALLAAPSLRGRVHFIHLNHTNRLLWDAGAVRSVLARGFRVARDGDAFPL